MNTERRDDWVSYLRVSTQEQAAKDLSLPAQSAAVNEYARRNGKTITQEYVETGCSGMDSNRKAFRRMLEDVLRPDSSIGTIVVHHTSRFTRNATEARVVKERLRKQGVKVLSVCQDLDDGPFGQLIEGVFECIDQYEPREKGGARPMNGTWKPSTVFDVGYEDPGFSSAMSEINGMRTRAAMREAVRQGFFPGAAAPYGFKTIKVEVRPGVSRSLLVQYDHEAAIVRELFQLYVASNGAKRDSKTRRRRCSCAGWCATRGADRATPSSPRASG